MPPAYGETYVMCEDCGSKIRSQDGPKKYISVKCPYMTSSGECLTPEERKNIRIK